MPVLYQILAWLGVLLAGGTGGYIATHPETLKLSTSDTKVWIEVVQEHVVSEGISLKSGDEIMLGANITTGATGSAILHFPDGSTIEVEPKTTVTVRDSTYGDDNTIGAKVFLTAGKLAFKIATLATPESLWEVKTGNAVAVVRGTEFTVWFEDGTSSISVTENAVSVATLDPKTGEPLAGTEVLVTQEQTAKVNQENVLNKEAPRVAPTQPSDRGINEAPPAAPTPTPSPATATPTPVPQTTAPTAAPPPASAASSGSSKSTAVTVTKLVISGATRSITEGDAITFTATATFSDGTTRDVTEEASWQVLGPIGTIRSAGVFVADLDVSTSEYGKGSGAIVATWKDPASGTEVLGKTGIFEVKAAVPDNIERQG